jgi:squalene-associated FAD-dependent desaturase
VKKVVVVGSGLAGLSAAVELVRRGFEVHLFEASKKGGGRAYSFDHYFDSDKLKKKYNIDNGQHILMGCYHHTLEFLKTISTSHLIDIQPNLFVKYLDSSRSEFILKSGELPYPLNLLQALLGYNYLSFFEKLKAIAFVLKLRFVNVEKLEHFTVSDWLRNEGQIDNLSSGVWEILCIGVLNTSPKKASAKVFAKVLGEVFLNGKNNSNIVVPKVGLTHLFVDSAVKYIESKGGKVIYSNPVLSVKIEDSSVKNIFTRTEELNDFDEVVFAIPHFALKKISGFSVELTKIQGYDFEYSSITTFHIKLSENIVKDKFVALISSPIQWVFNHNDYITTVTSSSKDWDDKGKEEIFELVLDELNKYLGIERKVVLSYIMIKEKRATFVCGGLNLKLRTDVKVSDIQNLYLAGDWTDTELPATIEGAVLSGKTAANEIIKKYS